MIIIKNAEQLAEKVNDDKDLIYPDQDIRIEYQFYDSELRDVECKSLYLLSDTNTFNFYGRDFKGEFIECYLFKGRDCKANFALIYNAFNARNFEGLYFYHGAFIGESFDGIGYCGRYMQCRSVKCSGFLFNSEDFYSIQNKHYKTKKKE